MICNKTLKFMYEMYMYVLMYVCVCTYLFVYMYLNVRVCMCGYVCTFHLNNSYSKMQEWW